MTRERWKSFVYKSHRYFFLSCLNTLLLLLRVGRVRTDSVLFCLKVCNVYASIYVSPMLELRLPGTHTHRQTHSNVHVPSTPQDL